MIEVLGKAKLLRCPPGTSLQDEGRLSGAQYGIPSSGAMDQKSFRWANHLLKNKSNAVALELSQPGLQIQFTQACLIALIGANALVNLNQNKVSNSSLISITAGDILEIGAFLSGSRLYLCIQGGFQVERYLESGSDFESITFPSKRRTHDLLTYFPYPQAQNLGAKPKWVTSWF